MSEPVLDGVAVVGMAGRFPGARDLAGFWRNLRDGVESVSFFSPSEMAADGVDPLRMADPGYVPARAVVEGVDLFDPDLFGFNPRDAEILDPQHRLFLECAWEALESAGEDPDGFPGLIGVFAGSSMNTYLDHNLRTHPELMAELGWRASFANDKDLMAAMAAYKLNLRGPAVNVQTACSSALVAIALASQALLDYQCDLALAGGVSIFVPHRAGHLFREGGILSRDGHCRPFDAAADGTVLGSGAGVVVLRRLADALAAGDRIRAVIRGMAVNNDGAARAGFTAPSQRGQAEVIAAAHAMAGVVGEEVQYVETHGTGTRLGDPVEVAALARAFRTPRRGCCALGAVKANIGHLDAASGVAAFIKSVLVLEHAQIPPAVHFREPNPELRLAETPFYVNAELRDWPRPAGPRRAGVSSFGIGGTNAHVVLEEAPPQPPSGESRPWQLLVLSARSAAALEALTDALARHLDETPEQPLADVAFTLQRGRRLLPHRRALVCGDRESAAAALRERDPRHLAGAVQEARERPVTFLLSGLGDHYPGMGLGLYRGEPAFREAVDRCAGILRPLLGGDLREVLYPAGTTAPEAVGEEGGGLDLRAMLGRGATARPEPPGDLSRTLWAQPAVFTVDYALACVWMEWGIRPESLIGHSLGEYVAACLAGVLSLEDALRLVAKRARLIDALPPGAMLAVALSEEEARPWLGGELSLAAVNGPGLSVVAGPEPAVASLAVALAERGVACRRLPATHAFHSAMMEPVADRLARIAGTVELREPKIPWLSNVTGTWMTPEQARDPGYWRRHLLQTVRFGDGVRELWREPGRVLLEVGPGQGLSSLALQDPGRPSDATVARSLRCREESQPDAAFLLAHLRTLWLAGAAVDWAGFSRRERRRRVELPTYPFQRRRFWIAPQRTPAAATAGMVARTPDPADWFYLPGWRCVPWLAGGHQQGPWLLFLDRRGIGAALADRLRAAGEQVATVVPGAAFTRESAGAYRLDPAGRRGYAQLVEALLAEGRPPRAVVHLWSLDPPAAGEPEEGFRQAQETGFASLLYLAQAAAARLGLASLRLDAVTAGAHEVVPGEALRPESATVLGPCKVVPQEYPGAVWRAIDLAVAEAAAPEPRLIDALLAELRHAAADPVVAFRGGRRWLQELHPLRVETPGPETAVPLREDGVYLITGGLGNVGLTVAERLARLGATVVLGGRTGLPAEPLAGSPAAARAARLRAIREAGGRVEVHAADAADAGRMRELVASIISRHGALHGVFHAAGFVDPGSLLPVRDTRPADWERHFAPKARGVLALERALAGVAPDFCLLFSSTSCVLGGLGFSAYAAANLFLDAVVRDLNRRSLFPWISADWDTWERPEAAASPAGSTRGLSMTPDEAFEALRRVLSLRGVEQVVVSLGDLQRRLDLWVRRAPRGGEAQPAAPAAAPSLARHPRAPSLGTAYVAPGNDIEAGLATVWQELLGIAPIGIHDSFFQLGGHSLLGTQLVSRVRDLFGVDLSVRSLFDHPTIAGMGVAVIEAWAERAGEGAFNEALEELAALSEDEVRSRLAEVANG